MFFFGFDTPRPKFLGRPSLWWVVLALSLSSLPLLGRWGESAAANICANDVLGDAGTGTEFCGTLRGFGPGFLLAARENNECSQLVAPPRMAPRFLDFESRFFEITPYGVRTREVLTSSIGG